MSSKRPLTYRDAGVDIDAGNALVDKIKPLVAKTQRPEVLGGLGGFGGLFHLGGRFEDPVLVSGTDGVGTKLLLAQHHDRLDHIGIDLVAMCVNDILVCGAEPLFFLDYFACGRLDVDQATRVVAGIAAGCSEAGCALIGGETAEMPDMYSPGEFDLAGFAVGVVERSKMITGHDIQAGDQLVGIASSGPHSNGYSLIRKLLEHNPSSEALGTQSSTFIDALLAPTRIYVALIQDILKNARCPIRGMAHITGGGLDENIIRVIPEHLGISIDLAAWPMPELFEQLMAVGGIDPAEMRRTFNMGIGYVLVVPAGSALDAVKFIQSQHSLDAWVMGEVIDANPSADGQQRVQYTHG